MIYIITGTSFGIGKSLANYYLEKGDKVIGISRSNSIVHDNFKHVMCDLTEKQQLHELALLKHTSKEDYPIRLINNAGSIGDIKRTHELTLTHYVDVSMVNIVAPQFLCSYVLQTFGFDNVDAIVNIASGAGERPVPSWGAYCASKAAINLFAMSLFEEIKELGKSTKVFNVSPGVVDTRMQETIRNTKTKNFSRQPEFSELKDNDELRSPDEVAILLDEFLEKEHPEEEGIIYRI